MNLGAQQFRENMALNQRGTQMQRGWTQQDWGYQTQTRELQWGWRQEDYAENIRFMTGRDRRLAERQMGRETIMHDLEGEQIDKQKSRQKELWKLEDQRFALQNKQFQENLKMQQEQLDKSIEYYQQNKALQEEQTKLERAQYIQQMDLQKEAAGLQAHYAELAKDNALAQLQWTIDQAKAQGDANKLAEDTLLDWQTAMSTSIPILKKWIDQLLRMPGVTTEHGEGGGHDTLVIPIAAGGVFWGAAGGMSGAVEVGEQGTEGIVGGRVIPHSEWESLKRIHNLFQRPVGVTIAGGASYIPMGGKKAGAPQIINIFLGNEHLSTFVLDAVTKELRS